MGELWSVVDSGAWKHPAEQLSAIKRRAVDVSRVIDCHTESHALCDKVPSFPAFCSYDRNAKKTTCATGLRTTQGDFQQLEDIFSR